MKPIVILFGKVARYLSKHGPLGFMVSLTLLSLPAGTLSLDLDAQGNSLSSVILGEIFDDVVQQLVLETVGDHVAMLVEVFNDLEALVTL